MYDYSKLFGRMRELKVTHEKLANAIHVSTVTLANKLTGISEFKQSEIKDCCVYLRISFADIPIYFFNC